MHTVTARAIIEADSQIEANEIALHSQYVEWHTARLTTTRFQWGGIGAASAVAAIGTAGHFLLAAF